MDGPELKLGVNIISNDPRVVVDWQSASLCSIWFDPRQCDPCSTELMRVCRQLNTQSGGLILVSDLHFQWGLLTVRHNLAIDETAKDRFKGAMMQLADAITKIGRAKTSPNQQTHSTK